MTIAQWLRRAPAVARRREQLGNITEKLAAIRGAPRGNFPTADVDQMLAEIEQGYQAPANLGPKH